MSQNRFLAFMGRHLAWLLVSTALLISAALAFVPSSDSESGSRLIDIAAAIVILFAVLGVIRGIFTGMHSTFKR